MLSRRNLHDTGLDNYQGARILRLVNSVKRKRMIVKRGKEYLLLKLEQVVLVYTENKIVYVIDDQGRRYMHEDNLSEVMNGLDTTQFFRANRQYILNIAFIKSFKTYEEVKLQVTLTLPELLHHAIIISQEMAPQFRRWIGS